jgi:hypothetical protein
MGRSSIVVSAEGIVSLPETRPPIAWRAWQRLAALGSVSRPIAPELPGRRIIDLFIIEDNDWELDESQPWRRQLAERILQLSQHWRPGSVSDATLAEWRDRLGRS